MSDPAPAVDQSVRDRGYRAVARELERLGIELTDRQKAALEEEA